MSEATDLLDKAEKILGGSGPYPSFPKTRPTLAERAVEAFRIVQQIDREKLTIPEAERFRDFAVRLATEGFGYTREDLP